MDKMTVRLGVGESLTQAHVDAMKAEVLKQSQQKSHPSPDFAARKRSGDWAFPVQRFRQNNDGATEED